MKIYAKILTYPLIVAAVLATIVLTIWNLQSFFVDPEFVTLFVRIIIETAVVNALMYLALLIDRLVAHCEVLDNWRYYLYDCSWWGLPVALPCALHLLFGALYIIFSAAGAVFRFLG